MVEEAVFKMAQAESFSPVLCSTCFLSTCTDPTLFSEEAQNSGLHMFTDWDQMAPYVSGDGSQTLME